MTLSKQQATLYEAVSNIDSKYIEETVTAPIRFTPGIVKRIAAIAAIIALLLTLLIPGMQDSHRSPIFAVQANASYGSDTTIKINGGAVTPDSPLLSSHPKDNLSADWRDKDLFYLRIFMNCHTEADYDNTVVIIEYDRKRVELDSDDTHIDIQPRSGRSWTGADILLYTVYGWFDKTTTLTVNFYTKTPDGLVPLHKQTMIIGYDKGYRINGASAPQITLSTSALLHKMVDSADWWDWAVHSNLDLPWEYWMSEYEAELIELQNREDAIDVMLEEISSLVFQLAETDPEPTERIDINFRVNLIAFLLSLDTFQNQMSAEESALFHTITGGQYADFLK